MRKQKWLAGFLAVALSVTALFGQPIGPAEAAAVITEIPGTTRQIKAFDASFLNVTGYAAASGQMKDRSEYVGTTYYRKVTTEVEFLQAITDAQNGKVKVIELAADMDLGWHEIGAAGQRFSCISPYKDSLTSAVPVGNPILIDSGISELNISNIDGLTIFSKDGYHIRHVELKLQESANDIIIRNIKFDETYEWDDWRNSVGGGTGISKRTGWTYIKVNGATNVWVDHCDFSIAFDGMIDIENGSNGVTLSWCRFGVRDLSKESMVYKSMSYAEMLYQNNYEDSFHIYRVMRDNGMSMEDIMQYAAYHKKVHLMGGGDKDYDTNVNLRLTMAYNEYKNCGSRLPMLRAGSAHLMNCWFHNEDLAKISTKMQSLDVRSKVEAAGGAVHFLARGFNPRQGGSIGADTCVYEDFHSCMYGKNSSEGNGLMVNSSFLCNTYDDKGKILDTKTFEGSSWDNDGKNYFTYYDDLSFDYEGQFTFKWNDPNGILPYQYQVVPLADTKQTLQTYGGCGTILMDEKGWLKTTYDAGETVQLFDRSVKHPVTGVSLDKHARELAAGEMLQLNGTVAPVYATDQSLLWESADESVATVSECGLVNGVAPGETTITVKTADGSYTDTCTIHVYRALEKIVIPSRLTIYEDETYQFVPEFMPADAEDTEVTWSSGKETVATIDENGLLTPVAKGRVTIFCTGKSERSQSVNAICTVTVKAGSRPQESETPAPSESAKPTESPAPSESVQPSESTQPSETPKLLYGDVDLNGSVEAADALLILKSVVKLVELNEAQQAVAEVSADQTISAEDALWVLKYVVKLTEKFPIEEKQ